MAFNFKLQEGVLDTIQDDLEMRSRRERFFNDPVGWVKYMLDEDMWSRQREVSESLLVNKNVAVKAGHGVGKSHLASRLICWWVDTRAPDVFVASTAPSKAQVSQIIWDSIRSCHSKISSRYNAGLIDHELPGEILGDDTWKLEGKLLGSGRKPPDQKVGDSFQGIHREYVLAIGDEACGLNEELIDSLSNITTNEGSRRFLIGNPTNPASHFARIFRDDSGTWDLHTISVLDSPNFTGEPMPMEALEALTGVTYVEDKKLEYGEDSARYKARILGEFAYDHEDALITPEDIEKGISTEIVPEPGDKAILGVDIAGKGTDRTVLYMNHGGHLRLVDSWQGLDLMESVDKIHTTAKQLNIHCVNIDAQGLGIGAYEMLEARCALDPAANYIIAQIISSGKSPNRHRWHNLRAVMWDNMRELLHNGKVDLDPLDLDLQDELVSVKHDESIATGGMVIQSKKDLRKELGKSPDLADAAVFAMFDAEANEGLYTDPKKTIVSTVDDYDLGLVAIDLMRDDFGLGYRV